MLSTKYKRQSQDAQLTAREHSVATRKIWTEETFREDAAVIAKLLREGKIPQDAGELILSFMLAQYISSKTDSMMYEIEESFVRRINDSLTLLENSGSK